MEKNERLQIRLSTEEKKIIEQNAAREGRSLSDYVVSCCINGTVKTSSAHDKRAVLKSVIHMEDFLNTWKRSSKHETTDDIIKQLEQEISSLWQSLK